MSGDDNDTKVIDGVAERLKFFFSDANVRQDKFMKTRLLNPDNKGGYLPIDNLLKFNSIKRHTTDPAMVVKAVKESTLVKDILTLNDDETCIGRVKPFTIEMMSDNVPLSLCVSNLPINESGEQVRYACTMQQVRSLFEPYGNVALVKLQYRPTPYKKEEGKENEKTEKEGEDKDTQPKADDDSKKEDEEKKDAAGDDKKEHHHHHRGGGGEKGKKWTYPAGRAYIEYETIEQVQKAADELLTKKDGKDVEPKQKLVLAGPSGGDDDKNTLKVTWLQEHLDKVKGKKRKSRDGGADNDTKKEEKDGDDDKETEKEEEFTIDWKPGCVIKIEGLSDSCDRESIFAIVNKHYGDEEKPVKDRKQGVYIDYSRGQPKGAIRFDEPSDDIQTIAKKLNDGDYVIGEKEEKVTKAFVLEGDDEKTYWKDFIEFKRKWLKHKKDQEQNSSPRRSSPRRKRNKRNH